jgi:hypothetical protein
LEINDCVKKGGESVKAVFDAIPSKLGNNA